MDHPSKLGNCIVCPVCGSKHLFRKDNVENGVFAANCESCGHFIKFRVKSDVNSQITLTVNGQQYKVGNEYPPWTPLVDYLRKERISTGTKAMCREGGCGICVVEAKLYEPLSDSMKSYPINSCLCPLFMCDGWEITTVEGINDVIPKRLAKYNGTQCGYCTPGQVMNMHALLNNNNGKVTMKQVEDAYDAVICRCTGYRPILDAMKSFAQDSPTMKKANPVDIEELGKAVCPKTGKRCHGKCHTKTGQELRVVGSNIVWQRPTMLDQVFQIFTSNPGKKIRLVFGNTGTGVYKAELQPSNFDILVDLRGIQGLFSVDFDPTVVLGAGLSINQLIDIFKRSKLKPNLGHLGDMAEMLHRVAGNSIRSLGCWAGNLMMKHLHPEFQSDVYVTLEVANAQLMIASSKGSENVPISQFLKSDMTNKVIVSMILPPMTDDYICRFYKVAQRAVNSHSYINAGIRMKIDRTAGKFTVAEKPCIVISGVSKDFVHAAQTETFLQGKNLGDVSVVQGAIGTLSSEVNPDPNIDAVEPSTAYRKNVALGYLYRYILDILGDAAGMVYRCGAKSLERPLSTGQQSYDTKPLEWPLTEPFMKLEAVDQASGKIEYINDIAEQQGTLHAAFVISTIGNAKLQNMDSSKALAMPGVLKFITAKDIPGENNCSSPDATDMPIQPEEAQLLTDLCYFMKRIPGTEFSAKLTRFISVLCSGDIKYAGQALAMIVAENEDIANRAVSEVVVTYSDQKPPLLSIDDAIKARKVYPLPPPLDKFAKGDAQTAINNSPKKITGTIKVGEQQHFQMETQIAYCTPTDTGMDVKTSTQWIDHAHKGVAQVLGIQQSRINVSVKRLGGAYGSKISRNTLVAAGCAVAAHIMKRPVKLNMDFHTNMEMLGRRFPYRADYTNKKTNELLNMMVSLGMNNSTLMTNIIRFGTCTMRQMVGVSEQGLLNGVKIDLITDSGYIDNEIALGAMFDYIDNAYFCANWELIPKLCMTNKPMNTFCRAPGSTPAIFVIESIMEHIAKELNLNPLELRTLNLYQKGQKTTSDRPLDYCNIRQLTSDFTQSAQIRQRQQTIDAYNKANRWKKRGLSVVPMKFAISYYLAHYNAIVNIYAGDGSISVAHGGIECGQGINTKVAQVCAFELGVPTDIITVKANDTTANANDDVTGGSISSELCCLFKFFIHPDIRAVQKCCQQLMGRIGPVKAKMTNPTWKKLIEKCQLERVDLSERHVAYEQSKTPGEIVYNTYGVTCTEMELDVLTGQSLINRVDILYDCGESMNPMVDIGQVEGSYVMGLGYYLTEMIKFNPQSGQLLTNSTWEYKPPMAPDIPIDFRISLLKNAPNPAGVLRSKACGEPPLCMSCSALFALKRCIEAARKDIQKDSFFALDGPATVDKLCELCLVDPSMFVV